MYLCHCLLPAPASLYHETSSRLHTISMKVTLERAQARPKDGTKRSSWETVISPAKLPLVMESRPLPGHHIRNSYWSKPSCWVQNNKTSINTEQRDLSVTHRQTPIIIVVQSIHQSYFFAWLEVQNQLQDIFYICCIYLYILLEPRDTKIYILN